MGIEPSIFLRNGMMFFLSAPIRIREVVILEQVIQMKPAGGPEAGLPGICLFLPGRKMLHTLTRLNTNCCRC